MFSQATLVKIKKAKEFLYNDNLKIIDNGIAINNGKFVKTAPKTKDNIKCRLSYRNINIASLTEQIPLINQEMVLFVAPEIEINSNMEFIVTKNGKEINLVLAGVIARYSTHQEIPVRNKAVRINGEK